MSMSPTVVAPHSPTPMIENCINESKNGQNSKRKREIRTLASAPGKLILFGEHAVVHGQPAIAAALSDLRIQVTVATRTDGMAHLDMPDLKPQSIFYHVPANSLLMETGPDMKEVPQPDQKDIATVIQARPPPTPEKADSVRKFIANNKYFKDQLDDFHLSALSPLIFLINELLPTLLNSTNGISVTIISSNLPVGAGLGSSAAFGVATSAALYKMHLQLQFSSNEFEHSHKKQMQEEEKKVSDTLLEEKMTTSDNKPSPSQLDLINTLSYHSETLVHGTPSGIDNAVSTYGGAIYFTKHFRKNDTSGEITTSVSMEKIENLPSMDVILTNTHVPRSTKELVKGVGLMKEEFPIVVDGILDSIGGVSRTFLNLIKSSQKIELTAKDQKQISKLIQINQHLLSALGVSHPSLNKICEKTASMYESHGCMTKLTGAGGGGCAFTFVERDDSTSNCSDKIKHIREIIEGLNAEEEEKQTQTSALCNYKCFNSAVGGSGVLWA